MIKIDGINIIEAYGCHVEVGGIEQFLSTPKSKRPMMNDWFERDGAEVDTEEIYLQPHSFAIKIIAMESENITNLIGMLKSKQVATITHHTGVVRKSVFLGASKISDDGVPSVTLNFREAKTEKPVGVPMAVQAKGTDLTLDGKPFSEYGIYVLSSDKDAAFALKEGISTSVKNEDGRRYHKPSEPHTKTRQRTFRLFTMGKNAIANYHAIVGQLLTAGEHNISGKKCFYEEAKVEEYDDEKPEWLTFNLKVTEYD